MDKLKPIPRAKGGRKRKATGLFVTRSFSLPAELVEAVDQAAQKRFDESKSAVVTEALADWFGISAGGEPLEKQQIPA